MVIDGNTGEVIKMWEEEVFFREYDEEGKNKIPWDCDFLNVYHDKDGTIIDAKPFYTEEDALKVGQDILKKRWDNSPNQILYSVVHYTTDNYWSYWFTDRHKVYWAGGGVSYVIDGNTGKIIAMWGDE